MTPMSMLHHVRCPANCPATKPKKKTCAIAASSQAPSVISAISGPQSTSRAPGCILSLQHASHAVRTKGLVPVTCPLVCTASV